MPDVLRIGDGLDLIDYQDATVVFADADKEHPFGDPEDEQRIIHIESVFGNQAMPTKDAAYQAISRTERLLRRAARFAQLGLGRRVTLTIQPNGMSVPTTFDVVGGTVRIPTPLEEPFLYNSRANVVCEIEVEPWSRAAEAQLVTTGAALGAAVGLTHHYLASGGGVTFTANLVAVIDCPMNQSTKFTTTPATVTLALNDAWYFGNSLATTAQFDRIVMGIRTAAVGVYTVTWEYFNSSGSVWTAFTPTANPFKAVRDFDVPYSLGEITFPTLTGWAATTVNTVSALWVRARISAFTSLATVPVRTNGLSSNYGAAFVGSNAVGGDSSADALVHLTNANGSAAMAGVKAALKHGWLTAARAPLDLDFAGADLYAPTTGDISVAVVADAQASGGERVVATLGGSGGVSTLPDRAQRLSKAQSQFLTFTPAASDKIYTMPANSFVFEVMLKLRSTSTAAQFVGGQWNDASQGACTWGVWIKSNKLYAQVYTSGGARKTGSGTTNLVAGVWYLLTFEFKASDTSFRLYVNAAQEREVDVGVGVTALRANQTTAFRIGKAAGGLTGELFLDADIAYASLVQDTLSSMFGTTAAYAVPKVKRNWAVLTAGAYAHWEMDDFAATSVIVDSGTATIKNLARSGAPTNTNDTANAQAGYFITGSGLPGKVIGQRMPLYLAEEGAGSYRVFLFVAPPTSGFTDLSSLAFQVQFQVGDNLLGFTSGQRYLPDTQDVRTVNGGWYCLDMGVVTLPPVGLYNGHRGSGSGLQQLGVYVYCSHNLPIGTQIHLDGLKLLPVDSWYGEYATFRSTVAAYDATYALAVGEGVAFDARGPVNLVYPTTTAGYLVEDRNPYADWISPPPRLEPKTPSELVVLPLRGAVGNQGSYVYRHVGDVLTPRIHALSRFKVLAS